MFVSYRDSSRPAVFLNSRNRTSSPIDVIPVTSTMALAGLMCCEKFRAYLARKISGFEPS